MYSHIVIILLSVLLGSSKVLRAPELLLAARFGLGITSSAMGTGKLIIITAYCFRFRLH